MRYNNRQGQAVVEMALFGSLILFVLGSLISYMQRMNDQQYAQMEAFRRALEKGCTYQGVEKEGAGAAVQYTLLENRKHADLTAGFRKGSTQAISGSANIFWAVPRLAKDSDDKVEAENIIVFKVNDDERKWDYRDDPDHGKHGFIPPDREAIDDDGNERQRYWTLETDNIATFTTAQFAETYVKEEDTQGITTGRESVLKEEVYTVIPYKIVEVDKDDPDDKSKQEVKEEGILWDPRQGLYRDTGGQYRFSEEIQGNAVERGRSWRTDFE